MKIVAFMNQKGGVGKTTTTVNVGAMLAKDHGKKVLLVDLDPQGNLSDHFGIDPNTTEKSIYDVIVNDMPPAEAMVSVCGVDVLPANLDLSGAEVELAGMMMREHKLKNALGEFCQDYDYVLLDCPPSLGLLTIVGLTLAHEIVVPMQAEFLALRGLSQLMQTVDLIKQNLNPTLEVSGVIFCMFDGRTLLAQGVKEEVASYFPGRVYETVVKKNIRLAESPSHGQPINLYDPKCSGAANYRDITEEFLKRCGDKSTPKPVADEPTPDLSELSEHCPDREPVWKGDESQSVENN